jgi:exonuclease SbcC
MLKVLHTGDWHIGSFPGPEVGGQNARFQDICRCLDFQAMYAEEHRPDLIVVSGDIFHQARVWSDRGLRESRTAIDHIRRLSNIAQTVVLRGTPNHDSEEQFEMLVTAFYGDDSVSVVTEPEVLHIHTYHGQRVDVACIPGFDRGVHRAAHPGLSREEETQVFTDELAKVVLGLKAQCEPGVTSILSTHFTVPGCNMESGQTALFAQFEPVIYPDTLKAADFDLVALGHIHRPQQLPEAGRAVFYCGSITGLNFNDEGQPRGFYIHDIDDDGEAWSEYVETPYREFETIRLGEDDVRAMLSAERVVVPDRLKGKIVRVLYTCSDETNKAFNKAVLEKRLYDGGVFYVSEITPEEITTSVNRDELHGDNSPEQNLAEYLTEKEKSPEDAQRIIELARPIISEAMEKGRLETPTGVFMPVEIEVKNYRNYRDELFSYDGISFATINGENGAGKSSLFMDAMLDALFEEPREGDLTGWIRNDPDARSGSIKFTFYLGDKLYRVTRTRTKSGKATLNLSEYVDESWQNRSAEKYRDTQAIIENTIGMDSLTLKATGLIMQDQYGLFLQADKADRMAILGNILGLGIYDRMESMAANRAADANRELRRIADLQEETGRTMPDKATVEAAMNKTAVEKASAVADRAIHTKAMSEAQTKLDIAKQAQKRSEKLASELGSWIAEKNANASAQAVCRAQISDAQALLDKREEVEAGSQSYGKLSARREELLGTAALIQPKEEKLRDVMAALSAQRKKKGSLEAEKLSAQATCWSYEQALADYDELERKAAGLAGASERLTALEEQDEQYLAADQEAMKLLQTKNAETARIQSWLDIKENEVTHIRSRAIMLETCGCPVENPECRFLQDAVEAKKKLPAAETELETYRQQAEERAEQLDAEYQAAKKKATGLNCRKDLQAQRFLVADLRKASERFAKLTAQKERLAEVKEHIKAIDEELETIPANIESLEADRFVVEDELKKLRQNAAELASIEAQLSDVKKYIELEKLLPAAEAKKSAAQTRLTELLTYAEKTRTAIDGINAEILILAKAQADVDELKEQYAEADAALTVDNIRIEELDQQAGHSRRQMEEIKTAEAKLEVLRRQATEQGQLAAGYEELKRAFSQDGIPHNIVRSIVPMFEATATSIISQMSGGHMSIEMRMEKTLKSNSKKEVTALDIIVNDAATGALPYMSRSGGERVKAALSVILALAELKSSTAGVQLGFLFIDEPPFLDDKGVQAYCDALEAIQKRYSSLKIMAITHDPEMKARFPQAVDVVKTAEGSKVIYS